MENKTFNKGDFIKYEAYTGNNKTTFAIFEGVDLAPEYQYTKKLSLALYYDSYKYCRDLDNGVGWGYAPSLDIATKERPCEKTIDTTEEDSWWKHCTQEEKEEAIKILGDYGYKWNEKTMELIEIESGEVVHRIIIPKLEYNGEAIKPICDEFKDKLKKSAISKNPPSSTSPQYNHYGCYCYDEYD